LYSVHANQYARSINVIQGKNSQLVLRQRRNVIVSVLQQHTW